MPAARIFWLLVALAALLAAVRIGSGEIDLLRMGHEEEYAFEQTLQISGAAGDFNLKMYVPASGDRVSLREEQLGAGELDLRLEDTRVGRQMIVEGGRGALPERVSYAARVSIRPVKFNLDSTMGWDDLASTASLDSTPWIPTGHVEIRERLATLLARGAADEIPSDLQNWVRDQGWGLVEVIDRLHQHCLEEIRPASFSGGTDALTALRLGESSCGGKSRLMASLCRTLGIPTRLAGGVLLGGGERKRTSHVWVEVNLGGEWVPFDPLNGYRAELPSHYLPLYVGDEPLIRHSRGLAFDYGFRAPLDRVPEVWTRSREELTASTRGLPLLRREQFSLILLAPFALLLTVFLRQVVGLDSIGVFLPVLLGFCVTQVGWSVSGLLLLFSLVFGVIVRLFLMRLHLLHVPRAAVMITFLVLLFLLFTVSLDRLGIETGRGVLILPLAALAMAVEKFTMVALDRGQKAALILLAQTVFMASLSGLILMQPLFKLLTVTFPEVLLVVVAEIIMIGHYRGLRWTERWRFRSVGSES